MANRKPKVGELVRFLGYLLTITELLKLDDGRELASAEDLAEHETREAARKEFRELREKMAGHKGDWPDEVNAKVEELRQASAAGVVRMKIRVDHLSWWPEREIWVADGANAPDRMGRVLSDAEVKRWTQITGADKPPRDQRAALELLEKVEG